MILKIIIGSGARGLLNYVSQISKAPIHHPHINLEVLKNVRVTDPNWFTFRSDQRPTSIDKLSNLSGLYVVLDADRPRKGANQVLLQQDAHFDLGRRTAADAQHVRWASRGIGPAPTGSGDKRLAPPTFSNFGGETPRQISAEFAALRKLKPNLKKAVAHLILSPGPEDRALSKEEWKVALDIALAEHGAAGAPHAAYLHSDTKHAHLHVFFSRIQADGLVISDSQSYQKNRSATKKITQELNLIPIPETPKMDTPGDRRALEKTNRRAERLGDEPIAAAEVRSSLVEATDLDDLERRLKEAGIEAEFQKRGVAQEIYGWKLRRVGSEAWIKSSSLAKDLSWPKIKHRFSESLPAIQREQVVLPAAAAILPPPVASFPAVVDRSRMPPLTRSILLNSRSGPSVSPLAARLDSGLAAASERAGELLSMRTSALVLTSIALQKMMIEAARMTLRAAEALLRLVMHILRFFGIGTRQVAVQAGVVEELPHDEKSSTRVSFEPFVIEGDSSKFSATERDEDAARSVDRILKCVVENRLEDLPAGPGRAELIDELSAGTGAAGAAAAAAAAPADVGVPISELAAAVSHFSKSFDALQHAQRATAQVAAARAAVSKEEADLEKLTQGHQEKMKRTSPILRFAIPPLDDHTKSTRLLLAAARAALVTAENDYPTIVPEQITRDRSRSLLALKMAYGKTSECMSAALDELSPEFQKGARVKLQLFESNRKQFEAVGMPDFAWAMRSSSVDFEAELLKARAAQAKADQARREQVIADEAERLRELDQRQRKDGPEESDVDRPRQ